VTAPHHTIETESLKVFRCFFAEGEIGGTLCMWSHISVHGATTKFCDNPFVFKNAIEKEGLPRDSTPDLGAGGPRFKSGRPDQNISRVFFSILKAPFTSTSSVEFWQTGGLDPQVVYFPRVPHMTNLQKHEEAGMLYRKY
jgi:hypothetical protein